MDLTSSRTAGWPVAVGRTVEVFFIATDVEMFLIE